MANDIKENVKIFLALSEGDNRHSNYSWDDCYKFFRSFHLQSNWEDSFRLGCLELGFYLASWGMYRGSSFLRTKNARIYEPIIRILLEQKFRDLWEPDCYFPLLNGHESIRGNEEIIELLFQLVGKMEEFFRGVEYVRSGQKSHPKQLEILITKILMGTMGCTPGYDRYFKSGLKIKDVKPYSSFRGNSFVAILNFCKENAAQIEETKRDLQIPGCPIMKIIDMYFWTIGAKKEKAI